MMQWEIVHIPDKTPSSPLDQSLVDVLACAVEPKIANSFVRQLNRICPLENLRHVKRVRRRSVEGKFELSVIVCLSSGHENLMEGIPDDLLQLINSNKLSLFKGKYVPRPERRRRRRTTISYLDAGNESEFCSLCLSKLKLEELRRKDDAVGDCSHSRQNPILPSGSIPRQLNRICPLENLRHVKRVRRRSVEGKVELSVIVCLSSGHENLMEGIPDDLLQLINSNKLSLFKGKVAKYAALSKEEWEEQCKFWPTSYHPPNDIDSITTFSEEDSQLSFDYMRRAIQYTHLSCLAAKVVNACIIVNPVRKTIIATAIDETCCSSTLNDTSSKDVNHNKLSATTSSPHSSANGSVNEDDSVTNLLPNDISSSYTGVSCLNPWGWYTHNPHNASSLVKCGSKCNSSWHPLRHAAMVSIEKAAARDIQLFPISGSAEDLSNSDNSLQHSSNSFQAKRQKTQQSQNEDTSVKDDHVIHNEDTSVKDELANGFPSEEMRPYLCTGFDIYLVWEPCAMCAMALVHQRIRRIFYAFPNPIAGALGSVYRLQGERSLNHHYSVFRIMLPEKALYEVE